MHNLFTVTTNIQVGVLWKKSCETFKQNPWKISPKKFIFSKVAGSKNEFICTYFSRFLSKSLSNLVHDFREDCFRKTKLLLAANRLIYLNILIGLWKIQSPAPSCAIAGFLHRISTSGVKNRPVLKKNSWYLFHEVENAASLYCENN